MPKKLKCVNPMPSTQIRVGDIETFDNARAKTLLGNINGDRHYFILEADLGPDDSDDADEIKVAVEIETEEVKVAVEIETEEVKVDTETKAESKKNTKK